MAFNMIPGEKERHCDETQRKTKVLSDIHAIFSIHREYGYGDCSLKSNPVVLFRWSGEEFEFVITYAGGFWRIQKGFPHETVSADGVFVINLKKMKFYFIISYRDIVGRL